MGFLLFNYTWMYVLIIIIAAFLLIIQGKSANNKFFLNIQDAVALSNSEKAVFIDIRSVDQFELATIATAKNIPADDFFKKINTINKKKPIILFETFDSEAFTLAKKIAKLELGYQVYVLSGGLAAWQKANMPIKSVTIEQSKKVPKHKLVDLSGYSLKHVTVYFKPGCPYCVKALSLFKTKHVDVETINIENNPEQQEIMISKANGQTTVPQIFIGDKHIGGCDDLLALDKAHQLNDLLFA